MIITISGKIGAGKTELAKSLAKKMNLTHISIGEILGNISIEKNMTINDLMELGKKEKWVHEEIDKKTETIGKTKDNLIIDGWIAFHFIPQSKKIFLEVNEKIGAKRIFNEKREDEPDYNSINDLILKSRKRFQDASIAYKKYYNINLLDKSQYEIIIDTSNLTKKQVLNKIIKKLK